MFVINTPGGSHIPNRIRSLLLMGSRAKEGMAIKTEARSNLSLITGVALQ
jgi:hypothetical protein